MKTYLFTIAALFGAISAQDLLLLVQRPESYQLQQLNQAALMQRQVQQLQRLQALQQLNKAIALQNLHFEGQMNKMPADAVDMLKQAFLDKSWQIVNLARGDPNSSVDESHWNDHWGSFVYKMQGWLDDNQLNTIQAMINDKAWHATNVQRQYWDDSKRDEANFQNHWNLLKNCGQVTPNLADDIMWLATYAAWNAALAQNGNTPESDYNWNGLNTKSAFMATDVTIKAMHFKTDQAKIGSVKPAVLGEQILENNTDADQSMSFQYSQTKGHTSSTDTSINFSTKFSESGSVGFEGIAEAKFSVELGIQQGQSWSEGISNTVTKQYSFPVNVPPHQKYSAKAIVQEADMDVPYELVLDFGGSTVTKTGIWRGVSSSQVHYEINPV